MRSRLDLRTVKILVVLLSATLFISACNLPAPAPPAQEATATPFVFPTATSVSASGSISGLVWHDVCDPGASGEADMAEAPPGCVPAEQGGMQADGVLSEGEPGIDGVTVRLGEGECPAFGLATAATASDGSYEFQGIPGGTYCVTVDASGESNSEALIPGGWTFPADEVQGPVAQQTVSIEESGVLEGVNFGWDFEFLPGGTPTPIADVTATPEVSATPTGAPTATLDPDDPRAGLGQPRFEDELNSGANWGLYSNDQVEFTLGDGQLNMTALQADFTDWWTLTGPTVEDFYVEGVLGIGECAGRDEVGLVVRSSNVGGQWVGYLFAVTCDGRYALRIWDGETMTKLISETPSEFITAGSNTEHRLGVLAQGDTLTLYVDGNRLTEFTDATYEQGLVGVFVSAAQTPGVQGYLDRIAVWEVP